MTVSQTQTSQTVTGLQSGKTYTFRVYARDLSGNLSKSSNAVTITLPGQIAAPSKPVVTVTDVGPTHASLAWSSTDNSPVLLYTIYIDGEMVAGTNGKSGTFTCARVMVPTQLQSDQPGHDVRIHGSGPRFRRQLLAHERSRVRDDGFDRSQRPDAADLSPRPSQRKIPAGSTS